MNYTICEMDSFSVIGQKIELTNRQKENIKICVEFWREFNNNLKKAYLLQSGNWIKYAFMERREDRLFYYCAIPRKIVVPEGFVSKEIASCKYMVVEHIGSMDKIYETYTKIYKEILSDYENFERFTVGKLDQNDVIEKNMILLGISRKLFTHSLPLVIAEQCYEKLLVDARTLIMDTKVIRKQEKAYGLLINIIDDYNLRLLSTKIYWDKPSDREEYKKFYAEYKKVNELKEKSYMEYSKNKEILFLKRELKEVYKNYNRYFRIIKFYKRKLVALGAMKELKNSCTSEGCYKKVEAETEKVLDKVVI